LLFVTALAARTRRPLVIIGILDALYHLVDSIERQPFLF
jgi:hypothetical protein